MGVIRVGLTFLLCACAYAHLAVLITLRIYIARHSSGRLEDGFFSSGETGDCGERNRALRCRPFPRDLSGHGGPSPTTASSRGDAPTSEQRDQAGGTTFPNFKVILYISRRTSFVSTR